jgi:beta-glucanase (GH16 family)
LTFKPKNQMIKYFATSLLLLIYLSCQSQYILVWQDEFDKNGLPDSQKWSFDVGGNGFGNDEEQYYTKDRLENAKVENGKLIITARREHFQESNYTSAKLQTIGQGDWKYGKFEIRAKLPKGKGIWPAIWMLPTQSIYGSWPSSGEIDIMELVGHEPDNIHFTVHTEAYNHKIETQRGNSTVIANSNQGFHTYGVEWTEDSLKFFVDDQIHFTFKKEADDYKKWPFDQPFYLILNVAVGGSWGGAQGIDNTIFPQTMEVDYVRVYKKAEQGNSFPINIKSNNGTVLLNPDQALYTKGSQVEVTAIPNEGYEFRSWSGTYSGVSPSAIWPIYFPYDVKASFSRIGEMLHNSTFLNGTTFWGHYGASTTSLNDQLHIKIPNTTANLWDIQLSQQGLNLEEGSTYIFQFKAKASTTRNVNVGIGISQEPWSSFLSQTVSLTNTEKEFVYEFTMPVNEPNGRVFFDMGGFAGDIIFSEVSLIKKNDNITNTISKTKENRLHIYPNPTSNILNINGPNSHISIMNAEGKLVRHSSSEQQLDLSELPSGVYYIKNEVGEVEMLLKK